MFGNVTFYSTAIYILNSKGFRTSNYSFSSKASGTNAEENF